MPKARAPRDASSVDWPVAAGLLAGVLADAALGDPARGHPVALFGRAATALERVVYADRKPAGIAFTATSVMLAAAPAIAAVRMTRRTPSAHAALTAAATWTVIGARSLGSEALRIADALANADIEGARVLLPRLCGRDPEQLDRAGIARAVVESVAENTSDAIVAPLVWGALGGPTGLAGYRAINTLDAMVGHHSPRYEHFGWASARLDDMANCVPARLTALLTAACAPAVGGSPGETWRAATTYGLRHPSPNAGWCEAAFAGALGVQLGGLLSYTGRFEHRPELGAGRPPQASDIRRAVRLSRAVTVAAAALAMTIALPGAARAGR